MFVVNSPYNTSSDPTSSHSANCFAYGQLLLNSQEMSSGVSQPVLTLITDELDNTDVLLLKPTLTESRTR